MESAREREEERSITMRLRLLLISLSCCLAACGARGGTFSNPGGLTAGPAAKTPSPNLFVADTANNAVDVFVSSDNGDVAPAVVISGAATQLGAPVGVAVAHDGTLYVSNDAAGGSVTVYPPGSTGAAVPSRAITCGGLSQPAGISLDSSGNLYVANTGGNSISVFAPTDNGCVVGNRVIEGTHTCLFAPRDVDTRENGAVYVASQGAVLVYRPGASGDATPMQKITGSSTKLLTFSQGVSLDASFDIYVTSVSPHKPGRITVYSPAATGNAAPLRTISGTATTLAAVEKIEIDPNGNALVTNGAAIDVFAAGASGNTAPTAVISGPSTTLANPAGLDLQP